MTSNNIIISEENCDLRKSELNEQTENIDAHIESLVKWCKGVQHLKIPTDKEFLLRFLRTAKYDHAVAQKRIDNFCTFRSGLNTENASVMLTDSIIDEVLDLNLQIPLGTSDDGQLVILVLLGHWDANIIKLNDVMRVLFMGIDLIAAKSETQIHGVSVIIDLDRANAKFMQAWHQFDMLKNWRKIWVDTYPMRLKNLVFYREPVVFDLHCSITELLLKPKMKKRTLRLKNDIEKLNDKIPGLMKLLPFEYNGVNGPLEVLKNKWKQEFKGTYVSEDYMLSKIKCDESKRLSRINNVTGFGRSSFRKSQSEKNDPEGTYTKFNNL